MEKKQNNFVLAIIVIAVFLHLAALISHLLQCFSVGNLLITVVVSIEHVVLLYYVLIGYRKPHGNLLRYTMLLFAVTLGIVLVVDGKGFSTLNFALPVAEILLIPYIAGRLNKIEQNKVLMPLVLALFIIDVLTYCFTLEPQSFIHYYAMFGEAIEWFALCSAYFVRYKEHKEAGLIDAPKAK